MIAIAVIGDVSDQLKPVCQSFFIAQNLPPCALMFFSKKTQHKERKRFFMFTSMIHTFDGSTDLNLKAETFFAQKGTFLKPKDSQSLLEALFLSKVTA